ncbi:hypothetical protein O6H91_03G053200 [Diphasiastrum complanatum]|uniref:Uncharacterized protein n=1 Tax=Diphasiastrum complanatum TaxID=34168 RepID=A0ACC2E6B2_DIPCM|nr:hypothetical protein O6H91_03G053200 [Diphasiastrum complanatum]
MASMEDPLTDLPPPSRFDPQDLFAFSPSSTEHLPAPFLVWTPYAHRHLQQNGKIASHILLLGLCGIGRHLLHHLPNKTLLGSLILPGVSLANNHIGLSLQDRACYLYFVEGEPSVVLAIVQYEVPAERSFSWVKALFQAIESERVVVTAGLQTHHFRGRLSPDDPVLFQLTTDAQRSEDKENQPIAPYFPSGSLVDGLAAALLTHCQLRGIKGRLLILWPDAESSFLPLLANIFSAIVKEQGGQMLEFRHGINSFVGKRPIRDTELYL